MSIELTARNRVPARRFRQFFQRHPEWWSLGLSAMAWGVIIPHAIAHQGHVHHIMPFGLELRNWWLMAVAMMLPLMREPLRWLAFQSFHERRHRAILLFVVGFLVPWMAVGTIPAWLRGFDGLHHPLVAPLTFGLAALWVMVPLRTRALVFCHRTVPLTPSGWNADGDCLRYGILIGASCILTCGPLMVACSLTGHNLIAMLGGAVLGVMERHAFRPPTRNIIVGVLLLAFWFLLPISYARLPY